MNNQYEKLSGPLLDELCLMTPTRIKAIRAGYNMTQEIFADLCGISYHTYKNWEIGHRRPSTAAVSLLNLAEQNPKVFFKKENDAKRKNLKLIECF